MVDKDWIQNRADELALEKYNSEFYDLPSTVQTEIYTRAESDYADHIASQIDAERDRRKYESC